MKNKVINIMEQVFNENLQDLQDDMPLDELQNWDSVLHLSFIVVLEEEFNIELEPEEITFIKAGLKSILFILSKHGVK